MKSIKQTEAIITEPLSKRVIRGGMWVFALRIFNRSLGFIRTIILARLLAPEDFGLLGIAMLSISTLETFSQTGFQAALIQKKENIETFLDTAWTVSVIRGLVLFLILFLGAPIIAEFFNSPQAVLIIRVIAVSTLLSGLRNIGIVFFQKELEFNKKFFYEFSATIADIGVAITLAFLLKNVWALVWGGLAANFVRLFMSYIINPYRPSLKLEKNKFKDIFGFGKWVFFSSSLIFLLTQGDDIFIGKILGVAALGFYQMAYTISNLPATEITHVISQVTFSAYSKIQDDLPKLGTAFLKVLRLTTLLSFLFAGGIFVLCSEFTRIFLADKWLPMVPAIQILCFFGVTRSINAAMGQILFSTGNPKIQGVLSSIQLLIMIIIIYPLTRLWGISGTSIAVVIPNIIALILITKRIKELLDLRYKNILRNITVPCIAAFSMVLIVSLIKNIFQVHINIWGFLMLVFLSAFTYFLIVYRMDRKHSEIVNNIREVFFNIGFEI
ncbi:lipopolysaccharide biosynthesis protein [Deltaproteobacteria bacterium]|nr:lipopolysaccharide biosynthesis protein [Deltaproteobacteria bacterium]